MEKWSKKISLALLSAGMFVLSPAMASAYNSCDPCAPVCDPCDPCDSNFCDCSFDFGVDFIYWKPCIDDMDYAARVSTEGAVPEFTKIKYHSVCPDWEPGVRFFVGMPEFWCEWDLGFSYTWIESRDSDRTRFSETPTALIGITSPMAHMNLLEGVATLYNDVKGSWRLRYNEWDLLLSYDISCKPCHEFRPFFGLAGLYIDQKYKVTLRNDVTTPIEHTVKWNSDYWGIGLRAGTHYAYEICDGASLFARADATLLAGEANNKNKQDFDNNSTPTAANNFKFTDDDCCRFVPGVHIQTGFEWDSCWCDTDYSLRLGWEFVHWHNVPKHRSFTGDDSGLEISHSGSTTRNIAFHGLLAGFAMSF